MKQIIFIFCLSQSIVFGQNLKRIPYLQNVGSDEITIRWRTDLAAACTLQYAQASDTTAWTSITTNAETEHLVVLKSLKNDTKFLYKIAANKKVLASGKDFFFKTAPPISSKKAINLWVIGDFGDVGARYLDNQKKVADQYLKHKTGDTDLWLWLGDNAYCCGFDPEYQAGVFDVFGSKIMSNTPFMPVLGNHDYGDNIEMANRTDLDYHKMVSVPTAGERGGVASGTESYYAYNYANTHFVALDSYGKDANGLRLHEKNSQQYKWLKADLEANKQAWTVVYYHHPVYTKRSHNSDADALLRSLRATLVPLFDEHKVDLVLSGHSHIYERSMFINGHTERSETFSVANHVVQNSSGRYDGSANSCPYIKKGKGIVYATVGSSGRLDASQPVTVSQHPTSAYSNILEGGSMLLKIEDNRLDARWITASGETKDQFTILKEVNKNQRIEADYGDNLTLNPSWNGNYRWNTGDKKKQINLKVLKNESFIIKDSLGCLTDTLSISSTPQPEAAIEISQNAVCDNADLSFKTVLKNAKANKFNYDLEISDEKGIFNKPETLIKNLNLQTDKIRIPADLKDGNYQLRIKPNVDFFKIQASPSVAFKHKAIGAITGSQSVFKDSAAILIVSLKGTPPWKFQIAGFDEMNTSLAENKFTIKPKSSATYRIQKTENACGLGEQSGEAIITIKLPLADEETSPSINVSPNPFQNQIYIQTEMNGLKNIKIYTTDGKLVLKNSFSTKDFKQETTSLKAGLYLLHFESEKVNQVFRILKAD
jgi:acid phosphatase type 7